MKSPALPLKTIQKYRITYNLNGKDVVIDNELAIEMDNDALTVMVFRNYLKNKIGRGFRGANDNNEDSMWKMIAEKEHALAKNGEVRVSSDHISDMRYEEL